MFAQLERVTLSGCCLYPKKLIYLSISSRFW